MLLDYLDTRYINHRDHSLKDIAQRLGHYEIVTNIEEGAQKTEMEDLLVGACCSIWSVLDKFTLSE